MINLLAYGRAALIGLALLALIGLAGWIEGGMQ